MANCEAMNQIALSGQQGLRGLAGSFSFHAAEYAEIDRQQSIKAVTLTPSRLEALLPLIRLLVFCGVCGVLGVSFIQRERNVKDCNFCLSSRNDPARPLRPRIPLARPSEPENGSFRQTQKTGNSRPDLPGMGHFRNRLTLHKKVYL